MCLFLFINTDQLYCLFITHHWPSWPSHPQLFFGLSTVLLGLRGFRLVLLKICSHLKDTVFCIVFTCINIIWGYLYTGWPIQCLTHQGSCVFWCLVSPLTLSCESMQTEIAWFALTGLYRCQFVQGAHSGACDYRSETVGEGKQNMESTSELCL